MGHYLTGFFRNSSRVGPFRPSGSSGTMKRFPTKVKGSRLEEERGSHRNDLANSQASGTNTTRSYWLSSFETSSSPFPGFSPSGQRRAGLEKGLSRCPILSPLSDDRHPLVRLLSQIPELVIGDNDPISFFSQLHHEPVSKHKHHSGILQASDPTVSYQCL